MIANDEICSLTLAGAAATLKAGRLSPLDVTRACLERIRRLDHKYNSFISVFEQQALADAEALTTELQTGHSRGPLHGIPIALKDLIDVAGMPTTAASALFLERRAQQDARVVQRLKRAGAVIIGKTNLHEFAYGGSGMISHFGVVHNPVNPAYITGGSSSGSAAAVAAGFCFAAIGTDTAGSIRLPAAYCGVVGLKPTYGRVSTNGVVPLSWTYDYVGPIARSVDDAATVLQAIADIELPQVNALNLRFGVARKHFFEECEPEIAEPITRLAITLGAGQIEILVDEDRTVSNAEAYAYHQQFLANHAECYNQETLRRIRSGQNTPAVAYINKRRELEEMRARAADWFREVDVVITPTVPVFPALICDLEHNPEQLRPRELLMLRNTRPFNVLGVPAMSVPCGRAKAGLPIGVQLAAAPGREDVLVAAGRMIERLVRSEVSALTHARPNQQ